MKYLMKCGHASNAQLVRDGSYHPACVICGCVDVEKEVYSEDEVLKGRKAKCVCGRQKPSNWSLPFFEYKPQSDFDSYYCGCYGWD